MSIQSNFKKVGLLLLILLLSICTLLYFHFESVSKFVLTQILEKQSIHISEFSKLAPTFSGVKIERITLERPHTFSISVENLTIRFSLKTLFSEKLDTISIDLLSFSSITPQNQSRDFTQSYTTLLRNALNGLPSRKVEIKELNISSPDNLIQADNIILDLESYSTNSFRAKLSVDRLHAKPIKLENGKFTIENNNSSADTSLIGTFQTIELESKKFIGLSLSGNLHNEDSNEKGTFGIEFIKPKLKGNIKVTHELKLSTLELTYSSHPLAITELKPFLPTTFSIEGGELSVQGKSSFHHQKQTKTSLEVKVRNLTGRMKGYFVDKLSTEFTLFLPSLLPTKTILLKADSIFAVSEFSKVVAEVELKKSTARLPLLHFKKIQSALLGGRISVDPFSLNLNSLIEPPITTVIHFSSISIETLLKLYPQQTVSGSGTIEGSIPVTISKDGVEIQQASIKGVTPGTIKLSDEVSKNLVQGNQTLAPVYQALEDFHYTSMNSGMSLDKNGDLLLSVSLEGRNPASKEKRPFAFNISISESIPALLKSINLMQSIDNKIKKSMNK